MQTPRSITLGRNFLVACVMALIAGKAIISLLFPHLKNQGLNSTLLAILIPIWSLGLIGLLLITIGWITHPTLAPRLNIPLARRPDGRYFSRIVKVPAALLCCLLIVGSVALALDSADPTPIAARLTVCYCMFTIALFTLYIVTVYADTLDPHTTTYLNLYLGLFAFLLIPLFWPILLFLRLTIPAPRVPV